MFAFSFAVIWIGVLMASLVATPEAVQGIAFVVIFPITFIASTFVPTSTLPGVLKTFAEWNPTSSLANALRHQFGNPGGAIPHDAIWPLAHPIAYTLLWAVGDRRGLRAAVGRALPALDQDLSDRASTSRAARSPARTPPSM